MSTSSSSSSSSSSAAAACAQCGSGARSRAVPSSIRRKDAPADADAPAGAAGAAARSERRLPGVAAELDDGAVGGRAGRQRWAAEASEVNAEPRVHVLVGRRRRCRSRSCQFGRRAIACDRTRRWRLRRERRSDAPRSSAAAASLSCSASATRARPTAAAVASPAARRLRRPARCWRRVQQAGEIDGRRRLPCVRRLQVVVRLFQRRVGALEASAASSASGVEASATSGVTEACSVAGGTNRSVSRWRSLSVCVRRSWTMPVAPSMPSTFRVRAARGRA